MAVSNPSLGAVIGEKGPTLGTPGSGTRTGSVGTGTGYTGQGMISPQDFVEANGDLTPVSFRFLNSLFTCIEYLEDGVEELERRISAAGIP